MGMECLHCKYILVKCKLYGPTETIEKASTIFEKKKEGWGGGGGGGVRRMSI